MDQKSYFRNPHYRSDSTQHAEKLARFSGQMADFARGEVFRQVREQKFHWSQERAAHEIGVTAKTIGAWEKGGGIEWANALRAAEVYGKDVNELVRHESEPTAAELRDQIDEMRVELLEGVDAVLAALGVEPLHPELGERDGEETGT